MVTMRVSSLMLVASFVALFAGWSAGQDRPGAPQPELDRAVLRHLTLEAGHHEADVAVDAITVDMLRGTSDEHLWQELKDLSRHLAADRQLPRTLYLGLQRAGEREAGLVLHFNRENPAVVQLVANPFLPRPIPHSYKVVNLLTIENRPGGGAARVEPGDRRELRREPSTRPAPVERPAPPATLPATKPRPSTATTVPATLPATQPARPRLAGGCCGVLTTAHSLTRRLGRKIDRATVTHSGVVDQASGRQGLVWNADFLAAIYAASGDADGFRGLNLDQIGAAHNYNPTGAGPVSAADGGTVYDNKSTPCSSLSASAKDINKRLDEDQDLALMITARKPDGRSFDHVLPIVGATFVDGPPCVLQIKVHRTDKQDAGGDFDGIPFNPGFATYTVYTTANGVTSAVCTDFPNAVVTKITYAGFKR